MVAYVSTVAFLGIDVVDVSVQVQTSPGMPAFSIVGLPDKAVGESRERVRSALHSMGLTLPSKRITVNLSPADLNKEGSHYDLPIALGLLVAMGVLETEDLNGFVALGELALDGNIQAVGGVLPAAVHAHGAAKALICPKAQAAEASWTGQGNSLAAANLLSLVNHFKGSQTMTPIAPADPRSACPPPAGRSPDLRDIKGQETAKRVLEIAAAGGHNLLMMGPPGAGKSMLAARLAGILPPMTGREILETSMIQSLAGQIENGALVLERPFRDPHHSASVAALVGGGNKVRPGEISLAHLGVLFLDELPEFNRAALEALRQPLETGRVTIARANAHISYPARVQLVAAMNPCRCGYLADAMRACSRAPRCAETYQNRISGPMLDRFDLHVDVPAVRASDLSLPPVAETSDDIAKRVAASRQVQQVRLNKAQGNELIRCNAETDGQLLDLVADATPPAHQLLADAADRFSLSARAFHRILRVARTIADLAESRKVERPHVAEALSYRRLETSRGPAPVRMRAIA